MSCDICQGYPNCPVCGWDDDTDLFCPECDGLFEITLSGRHNGKDWDNFKCVDCGYEINNEPEIDEYGY